MQLVRSGYCIDNLLYLNRNSISNAMSRLDVSCGTFGNVIVVCPSLGLRDNKTDSENVSLIRLSVSYGRETCGSKGVSLIRNINNNLFGILRMLAEKEYRFA